LAPRGDAARFQDAAVRLVDSANAGNAVFALIEDGAGRGVHSVSVGDAVDPGTVFQVASLSKWVAAWGVMTLVEAGRLDLDAPVGRYLTRWKLPPSTFDQAKVTVRRLLSHTAVLRPLGMVRSTFEWTPNGGTTLATFYGTDSKPAPHYRFAAVAAASLYTTVADLTRFLQAQVPGPAGQPAGRGVLSPATLAEMWKPHATAYGQDIWGLGVILYARNQAGGFGVGHDGNNDPAINTAARINPATRNGIVVLETGNKLLASQLAGEWVWWETGNVDNIAFLIGAPKMLRLMAAGALVIVVVAIGFALHRRRSASAEIG
jgi:CubicO group peptidase (beta-lactamase class C family)